VALDGRRLRLDLALRAAGASSSVELAGLVPLDPADQQLELRLASRGDGVFFLAGLADPVLQWQKGSADLQLLVRGSLREPIANGFVRVRDGELRFIDQTVRDLNTLVLFDFQQLVVQQLTASVGAKGRVSGSGNLSIWNTPPPGTSAGLAVQLQEVPFKLPRIQAVADGSLSLAGSLRQLRLGGDVRIARGNLNLQGGQLASETPVAAQPVTVPKLVEAGWDFRKPLLLLGPEVQSDATESLAATVPKFSPLAFDGLRLRLGPDLRVGVPNVASFSTGGLLRLSGRLDPSLRATGVVRLLGGRLNLFTTSFSLDPDAPNVAVFTPALGLMPYVDIAMRTRVADSLSTPGIGTGGIGSSNAQGPSSVPQGGFNSLSQLNLVRITVSVSGPADRLAENLRLRSSPPLSQERLIALIGGNSLAGLTGGGAGAALATVLGQSLLSPVLGGLSEAFGQRLSFALYPTYVTPALNATNEVRSGQVAPELVLGSEIGLDITERLNASVLAAPNRSDIPPQLTLTYKASENLGLQGGFDTQGAWQGEMQLFFRF
jgi:translocation and assembly module TamB